jgi:hypothetical protein
VGVEGSSASTGHGEVRRWATNLSVVVLDAIIVRLLFAAGVIGAAILAAERN